MTCARVLAYAHQTLTEIAPSSRAAAALVRAESRGGLVVAAPTESAARHAKRRVPADQIGLSVRDLHDLGGLGPFDFTDEGPETMQDERNRVQG